METVKERIRSMLEKATPEQLYIVLKFIKNLTRTSGEAE